MPGAATTAGRLYCELVPLVFLQDPRNPEAYNRTFGVAYPYWMSVIQRKHSLGFERTLLRQLQRMGKMLALWQYSRPTLTVTGAKTLMVRNRSPSARAM